MFYSPPTHSDNDQGAFRPNSNRNTAFTLVELLAVIAIILTMMALVVPALVSTKGNNEITKAAYDIAGVLEQSRAYAIANNTYVWVGFYEEDTTATRPTASSPANVTPPYSGKGRVVIAAVTSKDGTIVLKDSSPSANLPSAQISQLGKLLTLENVHITELTNSDEVADPANRDTNTLRNRSDKPYTYGKDKTPPVDYFNRVSSDSSVYAQFPFVAQNYKFSKTIMFTPKGEANVVGLNGKYIMVPIVEIGMRPTHGTSVDTNNKNVVAIQLTGVGGNVKIYRR